MAYIVSCVLVSGIEGRCDLTDIFVRLVLVIFLQDCLAKASRNVTLSIQ